MARSAKPRKRKPSPQRSKLPRYVVPLHDDDFFDEEDAEVLQDVPSVSVEARNQNSPPCIPQDLSKLRQSTLDLLRALVPSVKLSQITAELRIPSLIYDSLYDLASHGGIKGIRLEKKKRE